MQRDVAEFLGKIDGFAAPCDREPFVAKLCVCIAHRGDHVCNHVAMEGRLDHLALASPEVAFAGHDPVTQQYAYTVDAYALGVVAVVVDKYPSHMIRMAEDADVGVCCRRKDAEGVAVLPESGSQCGQGVFIETDIQGFRGAGQDGHRAKQAFCEGGKVNLPGGKGLFSASGPLI